jgi:hypothetical protein
MNYFQGVVEPRGIKISVTPVHKGERSISFTAFTGLKKHLLDMSRYNKKTCDNFIVNPELKEKIIQAVLTKNNLELLKS